MIAATASERASRALRSKTRQAVQVIDYQIGDPPSEKRSFHGAQPPLSTSNLTATFILSGRATR
eukprot:3118486-Prorocentrum_lima.AAC.1